MRAKSIQLVPKAALLCNLQRNLQSVEPACKRRLSEGSLEDLFVSKVNWSLQMEIDWESLVHKASGTLSGHSPPIYLLYQIFEPPQDMRVSQTV